MNCLILNGSPRHNGNTHTVLQAMKEMLQENHTVEVLDVSIKEASSKR